MVKMAVFNRLKKILNSIPLIKRKIQKLFFVFFTKSVFPDVYINKISIYNISPVFQILVVNLLKNNKIYSMNFETHELKYLENICKKYKLSKTSSYLIRNIFYDYRANIIHITRKDFFNLYDLKYNRFHEAFTECINKGILLLLTRSDTYINGKQECVYKLQLDIPELEQLSQIQTCTNNNNYYPKKKAIAFFYCEFTQTCMKYRQLHSLI